MSKNKLVLGTAQFGMDYGINNKRGKIPREEVYEILKMAFKSGIDTLDTAYAYGGSESLLGEFAEENAENFKIMSKLPDCKPENVINIFNMSLNRLSTGHLYGYYMHSFQNYMEYPEIWDILLDLKSSGKIEKIGFSLYYPLELEYLLQNKVEVDIIQVPYSIFDQRFEEYLSELKNKNIEIYIRSVFLQGLGFRDPSELEGEFKTIQDKITGIQRISKEEGIPLASIYLNFAVANKFIDKVIVGVDNLKNVEDLIDTEKYVNDVEKIMEELISFRVDDEKIILPINWSR